MKPRKKKPDNIMQHVSSSLTLFLKFGFPIGWLVFFGAMTVAMWLTSSIKVVAGMSMEAFRISITFFFLLGGAIIYWSMMRIKRVEMDDHFFYVTNYFKNVRYPYHQIEKVIEKDYLLFKTIHIHLKQAATFGKVITFIASRERFNLFLKEHPEVIGQLEGLKD